MLPANLEDYTGSGEAVPTYLLLLALDKVWIKVAICWLSGDVIEAFITIHHAFVVVGCEIAHSVQVQP